MVTFIRSFARWGVLLLIAAALVSGLAACGSDSDKEPVDVEPTVQARVNQELTQIAAAWTPTSLPPDTPEPVDVEGTVAARVTEELTRIASEWTPTPAATNTPTPTLTPTPTPIPPITRDTLPQVTLLEEHSPGGRLDNVVWSPDGTTLAVSNQTRVLVYTYADGALDPLPRTLEGHENMVTGLAYSPDGALIASGSSESIRLWDTATWETTMTLGDSGYRLAFSPDGTLLAAGKSDGMIRLWDVASGEVVREWAGHSAEVNGLAFNVDGTRLVSGSADRAINVWDPATGERVTSLTAHGRSVKVVAFSLDGSVMITSGDDGIIRVWNPSNFSELAALQHEEMVGDADISPDNSVIASGTRDFLLHLWDTTTYARILKLSGHTLDMAGVAFSPDGTALASVDYGGMLRLWGITR